jgi:uncharacterized protein
MIKIFRYLLFFVGLVCFGLGSALAVKVKFLGLHPWDVLNVALFQHFGLTIGTWSVISGLFLVCFSLIFNRKYVNIGTFLNALLIGPIMDFFLWIDILPNATHTWVDYVILLCGIIITGIGGGMYVAGGIGAGPRDGFMLFVSDKTRLSVSQARITVESLVLIIGYLLGGPAYLVSIFYTFIQSPVFHRSLKLFNRLVVFVTQKRSPESVIVSE